MSAGVLPIIVDATSESAFDDLDFPGRIVHCVGYGRSSGQDRVSVTVRGLTRLIARLVARSWSGRFVHVSSTGVYAQSDGSWVDEDSPANAATESGRACLGAEAQLRTIAADAGLSPVTIRLAGLYGPGRVIGRDAILRGGPIAADANHWLNLIHVEDAARLVVAAALAPSPRPLYLGCDDRPVKRREYYETLARLLAAPAPTFVRARRGTEARVRQEGPQSAHARGASAWSPPTRISSRDSATSCAETRPPEPRHPLCGYRQAIEADRVLSGVSRRPPAPRRTTGRLSRWVAIRRWNGPCGSPQ